MESCKCTDRKLESGLAFIYSTGYGLSSHIVCPVCRPWSSTDQITPCSDILFGIFLLNTLPGLCMLYCLQLFFSKSANSYLPWWRMLNPFKPNGISLYYHLGQSILRVVGWFDRTFCKQTVETLIRRHIMWLHIWVCSVCLCPTKRTLGFNGLIEAYTIMF